MCCDFALDEFVVTWGAPLLGGDSLAVQHQLWNVKHVAATSRAFAAILATSLVVTWGDPFYGGDSSAFWLIGQLLPGVVQLQRFFSSTPAETHAN